MLRVRVIGELSVERDGVELALPKRRPARLLLGWLALHPGRHARSTVASSLWPGVLDDSARTSLRTALSALRSAIGSSALLASRERVALDEEVNVDWREFQRTHSLDRARKAEPEIGNGAARWMRWTCAGGTCWPALTRSGC